MQIDFSGEFYRGFDRGTNHPVLFDGPAIYEVSEEKGQQLVRDFPDQCRVKDEQAAPAKADKKPKAKAEDTATAPESPATPAEASTETAAPGEQDVAPETAADATENDGESKAA